MALMAARTSSVSASFSSPSVRDIGLLNHGSVRGGGSGPPSDQGKAYTTIFQPRWSEDRTEPYETGENRKKTSNSCRKSLTGFKNAINQPRTVHSLEFRYDSNLLVAPNGAEESWAWGLVFVALGCGWPGGLDSWIESREE